MKLSNTQELLEVFVKALRALGALETSRAVAAVASILRKHGEASMSTLQSRWIAFTANSQDRGNRARSGYPLSRLTDCLKQFQALLLATEIKQERLADFELLLQVVTKESGYVADLCEGLDRAMTQGSIADFVERLKREQGTKQFESTLKELQESSLKKEDVVEIASHVVGRISRGTTRAAALKAIRQPHDAQMSAKRGIEATGGRSAA